MKMENKNKAAFLFSILLCVLVYALGSCTGDNDFTGSDDLSLSMQIPMTRSTNPESPIEINPKLNEIPVEEGACGLYALTDLQRHQDGFDQNRTRACYESMKKCAVDSMGYKPGEAMLASTMLGLGQRYGLLTGMTFFSDENKPEDYFYQSENVGSARIACFQKGGSGHYARITGIDTEKGKVRYVDGDGRGWVYVSKLEGIMYNNGEKK